MLLAILLLAAGPGGAIMGDFDRDGRPDRVRTEKDGSLHKIVMARSTGETVPVEMGVKIDDKFKFSKVNRTDRRTVCDFASLSRYVCDSGDVLRYGNGVEEAMAIWNGQRFIVYRPPVNNPAK